jgi:hypothetical protein
MRVTIVMGRGLEGCGVSKYSVEMAKYLKSHGHQYTIVASKDKSWSRKDAHVFDNLVHLKFADESNISTIVNICNESDMVILNSLPSRPMGASKGHDPKVGINFRKILDQVSTPVVLIQHDHNKLSIIRNDGLEEVVNRSDIIFSHAPNNDFVNEVKKMNGSTGLANFLDDNVSEKRIFNFQPGMNFDDVKNTYWKSIEQINPRVHRWIGRTTFWKGFELMFNFARNHLTPTGCLTILEGIEKSPAFLDFKNKFEFNNLIDKNPDNTDLTEYYGKLPVVFTLFKNAPLLERMSTTGFGYQLSNMDPKYIHRSIEYTHCEIVATGAIPVFRKEYGDSCTHAKYGDPLTACSRTGTIWLSNNNMEECMNTIRMLENDSAMRDDWREMAFEFYKSHQNSEEVFQRLFNTIFSEIT